MYQPIVFLMSLDMPFIVLVVAVVTLLYKFVTRNLNYWKDRGIPYAKPLPLFGNFFEVMIGLKQPGRLFADLYKQFKTPFFGIFIFNKPYLIIKDPDLIKLIMVKDFNYFTGHVVVSDDECDPMTSKFLFFLKDPEWRIIRSKVAPVFSSSKLKGMVNLINAVAEDMKTYLEKNSESDSIEAKEFCTRFTTDVTTACIFGIQAHSFQYENAQFRMMGGKVFGSDYLTSLRQGFYFVWPGIVKLLKLPFMDRSVTDFMREQFWKILQEREEQNYKRNDLIDFLIHIKKTWPEGSSIKYEGDRVIAQAGQFFSAGYETVSAAMSFVLYELCLNKDIQNKVRSEVLHILNNHGSFCSDALQSMKYLQMVVYETLRKYPVFLFLDRACLEDYKLPNSNIVIGKGTPVCISVLGLHHDPEYFPNPEKFDPERFAGEDNQTASSFVYLPFGKGPRTCIGARFALTVVKLGIAHIISSFEVDRSEDTPVPLKYRSNGVVLASSIGLPMRFKKIETNLKCNLK